VTVRRPQATYRGTVHDRWTTPGPRCGDLLSHPLAVAAVIVLALNDHLLKAVAPGFVTGKLSDVAGLVFAPLLVTSIVEIVALGLDRQPPDRRRLVIVSIIATGLAFALVKTTPPGTAIFAWSLGIAQWLAGAGPIFGTAPHATAVLTDPSDLIALPALAAASWVAARTVSRAGEGPRRSTVAAGRPSTPAVGLLVVAGLATMATSQTSMRQSESHLEETVHLGASRSAAVRHVSFEVVNRDPGLETVLLAVSTSSKETQDGMTVLGPIPGVVLTLIPDEPSDRITPEESGMGLTGEPALDLTDLCRTSCRHGATLVARLIGEAPVGAIDVTLGASLFAFGELGDGGELDTDLALHNDADRSFDGNPTTIMANAERSFRVGSTSERAVEGLVMLLDADVLKAPLAYPMVGTVTMSIETTDASDHPNAHLTSATVGDEEIYLMGQEPPRTIDLLAQCEAGRPCEIPVTLTSDYDASLNSPDFDPAKAPPGFVALTWRVDVRIEAFDGRALPVDAIEVSGS